MESLATCLMPKPRFIIHFFLKWLISTFSHWPEFPALGLNKILESPFLLTVFYAIRINYHWMFEPWVFDFSRLKENKTIPSPAKKILKPFSTYICDSISILVTILLTLPFTAMTTLSRLHWKQGAQETHYCIFFFLTKSRNTQACLFFCFHLMISVYFSVTFTS